jgi:hypothetical protein
MGDEVYAYQFGAPQVLPQTQGHHQVWGIPMPEVVKPIPIGLGDRNESDARKQDETYLIILKNIHVEGRIKNFWLIFFGKKDP